jgi:hypothetical protein
VDKTETFCRQESEAAVDEGTNRERVPVSAAFILTAETFCGPIEFLFAWK